MNAEFTTELIYTNDNYLGSGKLPKALLPALAKYLFISHAFRQK